MTSRFVVLSCSLLVLSGCASPWVKPGASQQDFYKDQSACVEKAQRPGGSAFVNPFTGTIGQQTRTDSRLYNACMNERGWSRRGGS